MTLKIRNETGIKNEQRRQNEEVGERGGLVVSMPMFPQKQERREGRKLDMNRNHRKPLT